MAAARQGFHSRQWLVLVTLMVASFLGRLDGTIVNLALPSIIKDFGITVTQASWISTAYIIANAIFVPVFGKLGDLIGRKPLYIFGIVGFVFSSMLAGLSFNLPSMVVFRILQAITVSIDYPIALSIIAFTFEDRAQRAQAMGLWSAIFAAAAIFGPLLGGPLIDNFGWRSVFYINVPLGFLGTFMALEFIEEPVKKIKGLKNFDVLGSVLLGISLGVLVLVLDQGQSWGWGSWKSILSYLVSSLSMLSFIVLENRVAEPIVDLKFFKIPTFSAAILTSFISFMGMIGGIFLIPLFAQNYLGYSVTKSGLLFIPMALAIGFSAQIGARLSAKIEPRFLTAAGMLVASLAMMLFTSIDIRWGAWDIIWRLVLMSAGLGIGLAPLTNAATSTVPISEVGIASSVLALARNISGAFGIAIFATILSNSVSSNILDLQKYSVINTTNPNIIQEVYLLIAAKANVMAFADVFHASMILLFVGAISALFVKESKQEFIHSRSSQSSAALIEG
ncbi:DHA2 family efflux MFS transporter permease subunit [Patescibacteria group bacterium]|nr:DHA2 family efflux MFS transporter permease subunit [Patescibacteria group bacterium]MCL5409361.1 DHA2 family efflux MFS transporter permease subunit [Patescibacteria group bacterium]